MKFCEYCFNDEEIVNLIKNDSLAVKGKCPVCGNTGHIYDTNNQNALSQYFEDLVSIYTLSSNLPSNFPCEKKMKLIDAIINDWNLFSDIPKDNVANIMKAILEKSIKNFDNYFIEEVAIKEMYDSTYLEIHSLLKNNSWDSFANEIKTKNRYHSKTINFNILEKYCSFIRKTYKKGQIFYRARISDKNGYPKNQMSAPPIGKSSEGRVNARGITCLYLANDVETTMHEVRAGAFDYVCVGEFELKKDITVVNFRSISSISPFVYGLDYTEHAINMNHLKKIDKEMSKPLRRNDSTLDYVPTQYIVDFIKSIEHEGKSEYDGIEFTSTTYPSGYNLAIFDPELFECVSTTVYDVNSLAYKYEKV